MIAIKLTDLQGNEEWNRTLYYLKKIKVTYLKMTINMSSNNFIC
jgi:hypothetical protein